MKKAFTLGAIALSSCGVHKEYQVSMSNLTLKSAEELYRGSGSYYRYIWYDSNNRIDLTQYTNEKQAYRIGKVLTGFVRK